jgi:hypothetical protein
MPTRILLASLLLSHVAGSARAIVTSDELGSHVITPGELAFERDTIG